MAKLGAWLAAGQARERVYNDDVICDCETDDAAGRWRLYCGHSPLSPTPDELDEGQQSAGQEGWPLDRGGAENQTQLFDYLHYLVFTLHYFFY